MIVGSIFITNVLVGNMKKLSKKNVVSGLILFLAFPTFAQRYTVGVPVSDTIGTITSYIHCGSPPNLLDDLKFRLNPTLIPYVTGLKFQVVITAINGRVYSNLSDSLKAGDILPLPAPVGSGVLTIFVTSSSSFRFITRIVGTPTVANESYYCEIKQAMTAAVCNNSLDYQGTGQMCQVQPSTSVADHKSISQEFDVIQNYPNPFNPQTCIEFHLKQRSVVELVIYNVHGNLIKVLMLESLPAGLQQKEWDGTDSHGTPVASGVYLYRLRTPQFTGIRRMLLTK